MMSAPTLRRQAAIGVTVARPGFQSRIDNPMAAR